MFTSRLGRSPLIAILVVAVAVLLAYPSPPAGASDSQHQQQQSRQQTTLAPPAPADGSGPFEGGGLSPDGDPDEYERFDPRSTHVKVIELVWQLYVMRVF